MNERVIAFLTKVVALLTSRRAWVVGISLAAIWTHEMFPDIPEEQIIDAGTQLMEGALRMIASAIVLFGWLVGQSIRKTE